jgi:hypothetical protein
MKDVSLNQVFSVRDAAYHTVREYPGGARALGVRVGIDGTYLSQQVNPNNAGRKGLDIDTAVQIQNLAQDFRILHAMALELGHVCIQQSELDAPPDGDAKSVLLGIGNTAKEFGEYLLAVTDAVQDGKVTNRELRAVDKQLGDMIQTANGLRGMLGRMNDDLIDTATFGVRSVSGR